MTTDDYLQQLDTPVKEIATELCDIIRQHPHKLTEAIKWNVPVFSANHNICSVIAHKAHVNLQLFNGAHLTGHASLSGTGKDMRHLKFTAGQSIDSALILDLLSQAIEVDQGL